MEPQIRQVSTPDGISWYVEQFHPSKSSNASSAEQQKEQQHIVLIPSGEGDCYSMRTVAGILSSPKYNFTVTTFDMPGFSRTTGPKEAVTNITPDLVAKQIDTLLSTLNISRAVFWGSSSGGGATLAIVALYPERVKCAIVHEVPFESPEMFREWQEKGDDYVLAQCRYMFREVFVEAENNGREKWDALGPEYHARLDKNYLHWQHELVWPWSPVSRALATPENLKKKPIFWTVGKLSPKEFWASEWELAEPAGIEINTNALNCVHFACVTIPEQMAEWIVECVGKVKE